MILHGVLAAFMWKYYNLGFMTKAKNDEHLPEQHISERKKKLIA